MFRFTIRDVLWLMVVAGLLITCWIEHRSATTWRLRANNARMALQDADRKSGWQGDNVVVEVPFPGSSATGLKVYRGN